MNKKLSMAVAGAVLAMGASAANAGITIPAGDWTIDIGGNVNAFYTSYDGDADAAYGTGGAGTLVAGATDGDTQNIRTGLLPSAIGIGGKTRQNDLDVAFQFTFFVGSDDNNNGQAGGSNSINIRQAYMTFGDKSWGTIKLGRDLGIFGSDAILSDMTLLGVGGGAGGVGGSSTLGRIGNGYLYADWVGQISYASPNWNGFSFAVGARDPWGGDNATATTNNHENDTLGFEGKVSYEWAGDVAGKVWAGYIHQKVDSLDGTNDYDADAWELGGKASIAGFGFVASYQDGEGQGDALFAENGSNGAGDELDSQNWYVQGTYTLPTIGTKIGLSYGETEVEFDNGDAESESWIVGAYHPLTKSVNLVAEYTDIDSEDSLGRDADSKTIAVGAIMFF